MARANLSYVLPEEFNDFRAALQGMDAKLVLWGIDQHLRNRIKYESLTDEVEEALSAARAVLSRLCDEHNVTLDE